MNALEKDWLTLPEAAEYMRKERRTIWRWLRDGKLEGQKPGGTWLISTASIKKLLGIKDGEK